MFSFINLEYHVESIVFGLVIFGIGVFLDMKSSKDYLKYETNILLVELCKKYGIRKGISIILISEIMIIVFLIPIFYLELNFAPSAYFGIFAGSVHIANYLNNKQVIKKIKKLRRIA